MNTFKFSFKAGAAIAVTSMAMASGAHALTLDTTFLQANSVFQLSQEALDAMDAANTKMSALGNATDVTGGGLTPAFNLPVTKVDVSLGLPPFSPLVTPNSGQASGSALAITRGNNSVFLANFVIDYSKSLVLADITSGGTTTKNTSLYSFVGEPLDIGLNGLTLNMHQTLSNLVFTDTALASFSSGLKLSTGLVAAVRTLDFGTITIDINGALRSPINATPYVVAVPEAPHALMLALGLCGIAVVRRRKLSV